MTRRIKDTTLATLREVVYGDPYHRQFLPLIDEIDWLRAELAAAHAAIDRVRALHASVEIGFGPICDECSSASDGWIVPYPCPTLRALDGVVV